VKYRLVTFDFDGTLADSADWFNRVFNQVALEFRFKPLLDAERELIRGFDSLEILKHLQVPLWKVPRLSARMRQLSAQDRNEIRLFPGIDRMLGALHASKAEIGIVSSNSEETIRQTLGPANADCVHYYGCGASIFGKASKLKGLIRKTGRQMSEVIYIGDETRDIIAAHQVGIAFGAVAWGYASLPALRRHSPALVFDCIDDILPKLKA
jgi:phosphoglycolate phosphatase